MIKHIQLQNERLRHAEAYEHAPFGHSDAAHGL